MSEPVQNQPDPAQQPQAGEAPPWGEDFDPERAWKLVQNLREDNAKLKERPVLTDELKQELSEWSAFKEASKTEDQRRADEIQRIQDELAREREARVDWQSRAVSSRVERLAAEAFADPSDALAAIDPNKYLGAGGDIDEAAIQSDLDALLERKPHWRRSSGEPQAPAGPRIPAPNPAQGTGGNGGAPSDPGAAFAAFLGGQLKRN